MPRTLTVSDAAALLARNLGCLSACSIQDDPQLAKNLVSEIRAVARGIAALAPGKLDRFAAAIPGRTVEVNGSPLGSGVYASAHHAAYEQAVSFLGRLGYFLQARDANAPPRVAWQDDIESGESPAEWTCFDDPLAVRLVWVLDTDLIEPHWTTVKALIDDWCCDEWRNSLRQIVPLIIQEKELVSTSGSASAGRKGADRRPGTRDQDVRFVLHFDQNIVTLDGEQFVVSENAALYIKALIDANGQRVPSGKFFRQAKRDFFNKLPSPVQQVINRGIGGQGGYRLSLQPNEVALA